MCLCICVCVFGGGGKFEAADDMVPKRCQTCPATPLPVPLSHRCQRTGRQGLLALTLHADQTLKMAGVVAETA